MLNKVILMGRLVASPELRHTPNGLAVTSFTLAVNRDFARQGEERSTDFIDIVAWRNNADFAAKYFSKGQLVAVDGVLQTRSYQDKNGVNRKIFEVVADRLHFAESKKDTANFSESRSVVSPENGAGNTSSRSEDVGSSFQSGDLDFTELPVDDDDLPF